MRLYLVHARMRLLVLLLAVVGLASVQLAAAPAVQPKRASFDISNAFTIKVPEGAKRVRVWFAVPQGDTESEIRALKVEAPYPVRYGTDSYGNRVGYLEVNAPQEKQITFRETFTLTRTEIRKAADPAATRPLTAQERADLGKYLQPSTYVLINDEIKALAKQIVGSEQNPVLAARKIYDWTLHNIDYWVKDPEHLKASPVGSAEYCLRTKTGNCTDFHSLFSSLTLAVGIPTRIVYGSLLKPTLNGLDVDASYHCWIQLKTRSSWN